MEERTLLALEERAVVDTVGDVVEDVVVVGADIAAVVVVVGAVVGIAAVVAVGFVAARYRWRSVASVETGVRGEQGLPTQQNQRVRRHLGRPGRRLLQWPWLASWWEHYGTPCISGGSPAPVGTNNALHKTQTPNTSTTRQALQWAPPPAAVGASLQSNNKDISSNISPS